MIRFLYIIGLLLTCMGLSVQARGTASTQNVPTAPTNTKRNDPKVATSTPSHNETKSTAPSVPVVTQDKARSANAPATPAKDHDSNHLLAKTSERPAPVSPPSVESHPATPSVVTTHPSEESRPTVPSVASAHVSSAPSHPTGGGRLARLTAYWSGEGDYYTGRGISSTGIHLHDGHCAVDPRIIPYGSVVDIAGVGKYLAVDTGSAVISREAARESGHNPEERNALVIDLFFESRVDGERFAASATKYALITWSSPRSTASTQDTASIATE